MQSNRPIGQWCRQACLFLLVLSAFQATAKADSISLLSFNTSETANITIGGQVISTYASPLLFKDVTTGNNFSAFCVDIYHQISVGAPPSYSTTTYNTTAPNFHLNGTALNGTNASGVVLSSTKLQEVSYIADQGLAAGATADTAAAAQLAIWRLLFGVTAVSTATDASTINALATSYVTNAASHLTTDGIWLDSGGTDTADPSIGQSMITIPSSGHPPVSTPEPGSALIMSLIAGTLCLGGIRRRFGQFIQG